MLIDKNFVHLHVHTYYSFLDGASSPKDLAKRAKELGMSSLALTDHNHLGACIEFQEACKKEEITPILGCEMYWTWDTDILSLSIEERTDMAIKEAEANGVVLPIQVGKKKPKKKDITELIKPYMYDTKQYHIILIAINQTGWSNLLKLQSIAADKCTFNKRYVCDDKMLAKYSEGLIMSTACIGNTAANLFIKENPDKGIEQLNKWHSIFKERFFVEIQPLNIEKQWTANTYLIKWAKDNGVKLIATNDVHYTKYEDHDDHDTLLCVGIGATKEQEERMRYSNDFWLKSYDQMIESFEVQMEEMNQFQFFGKRFFDKDEYREAYLEAISNTNIIPEMCEQIKLGSDKPVLPEVKNIPNGITPESWLTLQCFQNLYKYKKSNPEIDLKIYEARLVLELNIINSKGYANYFLIVDEFIDWANENDCPTGPGRGSSAGSLVAFLLGITKMIDPIKYNLLFFRFLTADRTAMPDIDIDFDYDNRYKVIEHLEEVYGKMCVSHIGTYTYMGVKSGLKDIGRVLNINFSTMNNISKKIDEINDKPSPKLKDFDALKDSIDAGDKLKWREFDNLEKEYPELFRLVRRFEGTPRNVGVHASGILITPDSINNIIPTRKGKDGTTITLYTGTQLEDLNFIKFDILGLKTISVIKNTLRMVNPDFTMEYLYEIMDLNDKDVYEMIQRKETDGLFQIESNLFKGMIEAIVPDCLNDIIIINSLGRPGPLSAGMDKSYARRKHGEEEAVEPLPNTWDIVKDTLGTICYQEQCMLIAQRVANFNGNQSDSYLRKALGKKLREKMDLCRRWLIYGKLNEVAPEGFDESNVDQVMYDSTGKYGSPILGGINNGYDKMELIKFWESLEGYADYLFNLSHSACYSFITAMTAYLKKYHPVEFMTALLSMEDKEEKVEKYISVSESMGITIKVPDINVSQSLFTPSGQNILFGLGTVKGIGETSIPEIINNRPYSSLEDAMERLPKKILNKRVGEALIKSGAFDSFNTNRYELINQFYDIRGEKEEVERFNVGEYSEYSCANLEKEVLGAAITYKPWWDGIEGGSKVEDVMEIIEVNEKVDKNSRLMAFVKLKVNNCIIDSIVFSSNYSKCSDVFDTYRNSHAIISGKKDDKGTLIINKAAEYKIERDIDDRVYHLLK